MTSLNELRANLQYWINELAKLTQQYGLKSENTLYHNKYAHIHGRIKEIQNHIKTLGSSIPLIYVKFTLENSWYYMYLTDISESDSIILLTILHPKANNIQVKFIPLATPNKYFSQE